MKIRRNLLLFILLFAVFLIGLLVGIILERATLVELSYYNFSKKYYLIIFNADYSVFSVFWLRFANVFVYFLLFFLFSLSIYLLPLKFLLYFYNGFILGIICDIIILQFGMSGVFIIVFIMVPQSLLTVLCMISASLNCFEHTLMCRRQRRITCGREFLFSHLTFFLFALIGVLYEIILVFLIFRPINFVI